MITPSSPELDAGFSERRLEIFFDELPDERRAVAIGDAIDVREVSGKRDENGGDATIALEGGDHVALPRLRLVQRHFEPRDRAIAIEEVIEQSCVREVVPRLAPFQFEP